jgi:Family of unknown function (DUF6088)
MKFKLNFLYFNICSSFKSEKQDMKRLEELKRQLKRGKVYRRIDLAKWSKSIDRHLDQLIEEGMLRKLSQGIYYYPKESAFGPAPPEEETLVRSFLKDDRFLLTSPNAYNSLGVGTTQLYNIRMVYNHKRHGEVTLGNRKFRFHIKHHFPKALTPEFLLVDLVNNIDKLAEDNSQILDNVLKKAQELDTHKLQYSIKNYANSRAQKLFAPVLAGLSHA